MAGSEPIRVAVVGLGKIARDQHLPAIAATDGIGLAAIVSRNATLPDVPCFSTLGELLASGLPFDAVALCTPPQVRRADAALALASGKHVLLEKPPGSTAGEVEPLVRAARDRGVSLFATWHSRFAPAVEPARALLAERLVTAVRIDWREDIRVWHPGQDWILEPGGLGVFDPGINALSILTRIIPRPPFVIAAELHVPANRAAPIAAVLDMRDGAGLPIRAEFDFLKTGPQQWDIRVETDRGDVVLSSGGRRLADDGRAVVDEPDAEYPGIYRNFVELVGRRESDVDLSPMGLVADAFLLARTRAAADFAW